MSSIYCVIDARNSLTAHSYAISHREGVPISRTAMFESTFKERNPSHIAYQLRYTSSRKVHRTWMFLIFVGTVLAVTLNISAMKRGLSTSPEENVLATFDAKINGSSIVPTIQHA